MEWSASVHFGHIYPYTDISAFLTAMAQLINPDIDNGLLLLVHSSLTPGSSTRTQAVIMHAQGISRGPPYDLNPTLEENTRWRPFPPPYHIGKSAVSRAAARVTTSPPRQVYVAQRLRHWSGPRDCRRGAAFIGLHHLCRPALTGKHRCSYYGSRSAYIYIYPLYICIIYNPWPLPSFPCARTPAPYQIAAQAETTDLIPQKQRPHHPCLTPPSCRSHHPTPLSGRVCVVR